MTITLMASKAIAAGVAGVIKRSASLGADIHLYAVQALLHAEKHGDPCYIDRLVTGLHAANRPVALKTWVQQYSPIRWNGDGKCGLLPKDAKGYTPFDVEGANAHPYYEQVERVGQPLTLMQLLAMVQRAASKTASYEEKGEIAEGENVVLMRNFSERLTKLVDETKAKAEQPVSDAAKTTANIAGASRTTAKQDTPARKVAAARGTAPKAPKPARDAAREPVVAGAVHAAQVA